MKIQYFVLMLFCVMCCSSCLTMGITFSNKTKSYRDFVDNERINTDCKWEISCESKHYQSAKENFRYTIRISENSENAVVLNDFKLLDKQYCPILAEYYAYVSVKDSTTLYNSFTDTLKIDTLPVVLRETGAGKADRIQIVVVTKATVKELKSVRVEYDFIVGNKRYISSEIVYKRHFNMYFEGLDNWSFPAYDNVGF